MCNKKKIKKINIFILDQDLMDFCNTSIIFLNENERKYKHFDSVTSVTN